MKAHELREKTDEELVKELDALKDELFNLRFQQATGELENTARLKTVKKTIARIKTIQTERKKSGSSTVVGGKTSGRKKQTRCLPWTCCL